MTDAPPLFDRVFIERGTYAEAHGPELAGQTVYIVSLADGEFGRLFDYIGADPDAADRAAVDLARDFAVPIHDRTKGALEDA